MTHEEWLVEMKRALALSDRRQKIARLKWLVSRSCCATCEPTNSTEPLVVEDPAREVEIALPGQADR